MWNTIVDGFGNHDPVVGRYGGKRPPWDELHPGRPWAKKCQPAKLTFEQISAAIGDYYKLMG